jgi:hypothetical protein
MSDARQTEQSKFPPVLIMIACALVVTGTLITIYALADPRLRGSITNAYGESFVFINTIYLLLAVAGAAGYWKMRRWGVYAYTAMLALSTPYNIVIGIPFGVAYLTPLAICAIGWLYFGKMK